MDSEKLDADQRQAIHEQFVTDLCEIVQDYTKRYHLNEVELIGGLEIVKLTVFESSGEDDDGG